MSSSSFPNPVRVLRRGERDEEIIKALKNEGFDINACMQCGTCTASCLSGRWTALTVRKVMRKAALGDSSVLESSDIWMCTTCYNCYDRCPRDLKVTDAIIVLRNLASARGFIHKNHRKVVQILAKTGHAVPINDKIQQVRKELGLPKIPPTLAKYPEERELLAKTLFQLAPEEGDEQ